MSDDLLPVTAQWCDCCQGEGRIYSTIGCMPCDATGWLPYEEVDEGPCLECDGTGGALMATLPVTEEEIMEPSR